MTTVTQLNAMVTYNNTFGKHDINALLQKRAVVIPVHANLISADLPVW